MARGSGEVIQKKGGYAPKAAVPQPKAPPPKPRDADRSAQPPSKNGSHS